MARSFGALKTMVTIFFLLSGNASLGLELRGTSKTTTGDSLKNEAKWKESEDYYSVALRVYMDNYSSNVLVDPQLHLAGGTYVTAVPSVGQLKREGWSMHNTPGRRSGVWGLASWKIQGTEKRLVLMFSVPWGNYDTFVGMGVINDGTVPTYHWWDKMSNRECINNVEYRIKKGKDELNWTMLKEFNLGTFKLGGFMIQDTANNRWKQKLWASFHPTAEK